MTNLNLMKMAQMMTTLVLVSHRLDQIKNNRYKQNLRVNNLFNTRNLKNTNKIDKTYYQ